MPSLVLFNQRTLFSGDDLRLYAVGSIFIRVVELCIACTLLHVIFQQKDYEEEREETQLDIHHQYAGWWLCDDDENDDADADDMEVWNEQTQPPSSPGQDQEEVQIQSLTHGRIVSQIYVTSYIAMTIVSITLLAIMFVASGLGTPTMYKERETILHPLCHFRLTLLNLVTCLIFLLGILSLWNITDYCDTYWYSNSATTTAVEMCNISMPITDDSFLYEDIRHLACPTYDVWYTLLMLLVVFHGFGIITVFVSIGYFGCFCCGSANNCGDTCNTCCIQTASTARTLHDMNRTMDGNNCMLEAKTATTRSVINSSEEEGNTNNSPTTLRDITPPGTNFWRNALHCCCGISSLLSCCIFGGSEVVQLGDFSDFALALSDYFHHNGILDVTPSDVVAGLLLVRRKQQEIILQRRKDIMIQLEDYQKENKNSSVNKIKKDILKSLGHLQSYVDSYRQQQEDHGSSSSSSGSAPWTSIYEDDASIELFDPDASSDGSKINDKGGVADFDDASDTENEIEIEDLKDTSGGNGASHKQKKKETFESKAKYGTQQKRSEREIRSASSLSLSLSSLDTSLVFAPAGRTTNILLDDNDRSSVINSGNNDDDNNKNSGSSRHGLTRQSNVSWSHSLSTREGILHELLGKDPILRPMFRDILNPITHTRDRYIIAEGARFIAMAEAMYSWLMYLLEHPVTGCVKLGYRSITSCACCYCCCCCLCCARRHPECRQRCGCDNEGDDDDSIDGDDVDEEGESVNRRPRRNGGVNRHVIVHDNPCHAHSFALQRISGLDRNDIVYAQFRQGIQVKPYGIMLDHAWKSVVLAIRGTLSLEDMLADVMVRPCELKSLGEELGFDGQGKFCHAGMLASAEWIYRDLERHGKLDSLLLGEHAEFKNYRLRITGHSLGAGCAAILSLLLKPKYPNLRCLAFSPPGCVSSSNLAEELSEWTTSYILDADIVPRLSIQSFETLRREVLEMVCKIKIPKYQVLGYKRKQRQKNREALAEANSRTLYDDEDIPVTRFQGQLQEFFDFESVVKKKRAHPNNELYVTELYTPGKIVHLFRTEEKAKFMQELTPSGSRFSSAGFFISGSFVKSERSQIPELENSTVSASSVGTRGKNGTIMYTARWAEREDLREIILSKHSLTDHNPIDLKNQLRRIAEQAGLEPPYANVLSDNTFE